MSALLGCCYRLDKDNKPGKFYDTGEDQHGVVAKRYGTCAAAEATALPYGNSCAGA
jgi:hypothetical protein